MDAASTPIASLVIAAGLLRSLGAEEYGLIVIALAVSGLSTAINPAIAATTTKFVSEASGSGAGNRQIARIITSSLAAVAVMGAVLLALAIAFRRPLSLLCFGPRIVSERADVAGMLLLAIASICLQQIDGVFAAALKGLEQFRRQALVEMCSRGTLAATAIATAWLTRDARLVLLDYCCVCGASSIVRALVVRASVADKALFAQPVALDFNRLLGFGAWMWLTAIATIAYGTVDRIILGRVAGASAAAEFSIYIQLAQLVHFVPASLFSFSYPVFSRLGVRRLHNAAALERLYSRYLGATSCTGFSIALLIVAFRHKALDAVGGGALQQQHDLAFILLVVNFAILSLNVVPYYLVLGIGSPRFASLITSVSMLGSIVLTAFLTPALGLQGAAEARLAYAVGTLTLLLQARRLLHRA